jgi:hypothetical protein
MGSKLNVSAALTAAQETQRAFDQAAGRDTEPEAPPDIRKKKTLSLRMSEEDFYAVSQAALDARLGKSDFCRILVMHAIEQIKAGAIKVRGGGVIDMRK